MKPCPMYNNMSYKDPETTLLGYLIGGSLSEIEPYKLLNLTRLRSLRDSGSGPPQDSATPSRLKRISADLGQHKYVLPPQ